MTDTIACNFKLGKQTKVEIQAIADREHRSLGAQIRLIIEEYLSNKK